MIRIATYLDKEKQNSYVNPVTGESWQEERLRVHNRRRNNVRNYGFEYVGCIFKMLLGLLPIGMIIYILANGL